MNQETQKPAPPGPRARLAREAAVLQLKLLADGFRDAVLIPISLIAAVIGLIRGGENADREFRQVIKLGRRSERWIDLFDHRRPQARSHPASSIDSLVDRVEQVIKDQYRKGMTSGEAKAVVEEALEKLRSSGRSGRSTKE